MVDVRPKVLIVAQNASSRIGGEAFLPVKYFQILRQRGYPAKLIAHVRNRPDLSQTLAPFMDDIHFIQDTAWHRNVWRLGKPLPTAIRKPVFGNIVGQINEIYQKRLIRELIADGQVDLIHQPIPVSPRGPSSLHNLGVPVVIGPMNGNMSYPDGYQDYDSRAEQIFTRGARVFAPLVNRIIPGKRKAAVLLIANQRSGAALPVGHPHVVELVENGVDLSVWTQPALQQKTGTRGALHLVFMGRLIRLKGMDFTLEAIAKARARGADVTMTVLGDGPERASLEALSQRLGLAEVVRFLGYRPQTECAEVLRGSDALILASLHECGGAVVLEAMSMGRPVIAADWGGPADYLDPSCGILVDPVPRGSFATRLADAIFDLANDPEKRHTMGEAGIRKIHTQFDWEKKMDRMLEIYDAALKTS